MTNDILQRRDEVRSQPLDAGAMDLLLAEIPVDPQFVISHLREHFHRMRTAPVRGMPQARRFRCKGEQLGTACDLIKLAQIVEKQLCALTVGERGALGQIRTAIPQQPVAQSAVRHVAELLFNGLQRRPYPDARCQLEAQGEQCGEPANRA